MKYATMWYGIQILAETETDCVLLKDLVGALPRKAEHDYDESEINTISADDINSFGGGFTKEEAKKSKMIIEILR